LNQNKNEKERLSQLISRRWLFRLAFSVFGVVILIALVVLIAVSISSYRKVAKERAGEYPVEATKAIARLSPETDQRSMTASVEGLAFESAEKQAASLSYAFGTPAHAQERTPRIIYTGSLTVKVAKLSESADKILSLLPAFGGYLSQRNDSTTGTSQFIQMTVRLPSENLEKFVNEVKAFGEVLAYNLGSQEVTEEFMDLEARLKQLRLSEERLLEMMRRSGKLSELLEVERELTNKQSEIERIQGRLRYLEDRVAYSTLTVTLTTEAPPPQMAGFTWGFGETFKSAWLSLKITFRSLAKGLIWIAVYTPIWLGIGVIVWLLYLLGRRIFAV